MWATSLCLLAATGGDLLLNEVLYDPPGGDAGFEFVELVHFGEAPVSLDGISLQFVNGDAPGSPSELWRAPAGLVLEPGRHFVLGESEVTARDLTVELGLQNGPDALWLLRNGARIDALAWGELEGLGEGAPAADVSGRSLGRVPDGVDVDDNALDFRALDEPTPGFANSRAVQFVPAAWTLQPPWLESAGNAIGRLRWIAQGDAPQQRAELRVLLDGLEVLRGGLLAARLDTVGVEFALRLEPGSQRLRVELRSSSGDDFQEHAISCGLRELHLAEILPRPHSGESEWVELRCPVPADCAGRRYGLADRDATARPLQLPAELRGEYLVVAADCGALLARDPDLLCLELETSWPGLNDRGDGEAPADVVHLFDGDGVLIDRVAYAGEIERGRSYEAALRGSQRSWFHSPVEPTPGRANATQSALPSHAGLSLDPNPWNGSSALLHVLLQGISAASRADAEVRDLRGRLVRSLGEADGGTLRQWIWDGRDEAGRILPAGAYVVLAIVDDGMGRLQRHRALLALGALR